MNRSEYLNRIVERYEQSWGTGHRALAWPYGPTHELPPAFEVHEFPPTSENESWVYATVGMSMQTDAMAIEAHLLSPEQSDSLVELLTVVAHYHRTGASLDVGHTVNFGRPWLPGSQCDHGLISLPYLFGPALEELHWNGSETRLLWLLPITQSEVEYKKLHGLEALEALFEQGSLNYLDPRRPAVV